MLHTSKNFALKLLFRSALGIISRMTKNQIFQVYGGPLCMAIDFFDICPNYFVFLFIFFIFSFSFLSIFFHFEKKKTTTTTTTKRKEKKNTSKINVFFFNWKKKVTWPIMTRGPLVRWPTTVMVKPKRSRRNQIAHGKTKKLKAKPNSSRKNQKANDKTK